MAYKPLIAESFVPGTDLAVTPWRAAEMGLANSSGAHLRDLLRDAQKTSQKLTLAFEKSNTVAKRGKESMLANDQLNIQLAIVNDRKKTDVERITALNNIKALWAVEMQVQAVDADQMNTLLNTLTYGVAYKNNSDALKLEFINTLTTVFSTDYGNGNITINNLFAGLDSVTYLTSTLAALSLTATGDMKDASVAAMNALFGAGARNKAAQLNFPINVDDVNYALAMCSRTLTLTSTPLQVNQVLNLTDNALAYAQQSDMFTDQTIPDTFALLNQAASILNTQTVDLAMQASLRLNAYQIVSALFAKESNYTTDTGNVVPVVSDTAPQLGLAAIVQWEILFTGTPVEGIVLGAKFSAIGRVVDGMHHIHLTQADMREAATMVQDGLLSLVGRTGADQVGLKNLGFGVFETMMSYCQAAMVNKTMPKDHLNDLAFNQYLAGRLIDYVQQENGMTAGDVANGYPDFRSRALEDVQILLGDFVFIRTGIVPADVESFVTRIGDIIVVEKIQDGLEGFVIAALNAQRFIVNQPLQFTETAYEPLVKSLISVANKDAGLLLKQSSLDETMSYITYHEDPIVSKDYPNLMRGDIIRFSDAFLSTEILDPVITVMNDVSRVPELRDKAGALMAGTCIFNSALLNPTSGAYGDKYLTLLQVQTADADRILAKADSWKNATLDAVVLDYTRMYQTLTAGNLQFYPTVITDIFNFSGVTRFGFYTTDELLNQRDGYWLSQPLTLMHVGNQEQKYLEALDAGQVDKRLGEYGLIPTLQANDFVNYVLLQSDVNFAGITPPALAPGRDRQLGAIVIQNYSILNTDPLDGATLTLLNDNLQANGVPLTTAKAKEMMAEATTNIGFVGLYGGTKASLVLENMPLTDPDLVNNATEDIALKTRCKVVVPLNGPSACSEVTILHTSKGDIDYRKTDYKGARYKAMQLGVKFANGASVSYDYRMMDDAKLTSLEVKPAGFDMTQITFSDAELAKGTKYMLQVSEDKGKTFNTIGEPKAAKVHGGQYTFYDAAYYNDPALVVYRVIRRDKAVATDGSIAFTYSAQEVSQLGENVSPVKGTFKVFPDPVTIMTDMKIDYNVTNPGAVKFVLYDLRGAKAREIDLGNLDSGSGQAIMNTAGLAQGMYYMQMVIDGVVVTGARNYQTPEGQKVNQRVLIVGSSP